MGLFLQAAIVPDCSESVVRNAVAAVAEKYSQELESPNVGESSEHDIIDLIPKDCKYQAAQNGISILFNEDCIGYESLAGALSEELGKAVMLLYIYDGDYWGYFLYDKGLEIDRFVPMPDYFEAVSKDEKQQMKGNVDLVAKYFHVDKASIEKYIVFWTDKMMNDYSAKAYEDDEFGQCEDWQMVDFMRKLGYPYEW